ncbi:MAG TPA: HupE/UreJ family protein [Steroidobacteraceae bacterium]|nr:HupE/UreJ family protein [Steroidobacteraceae bacterium]
MSAAASLALMWMLSPMARAHVASNGFLVVQLHDRQLSGSIELAVRDVELAIGVDANRDGKVTWGELRAGEPQLMQYVAQHLSIGAQNSTCPISFQALQVNERVDGNYAWLPFTAHCPLSVRELRIRYSLMDDFDPSHRALLTLIDGAIAQTGVLGGRGAPALFTLDAPSRARAFVEYLQVGIWHIWSGIDHLLFLFSLLLPAVLLRKSGRWEPMPRVRPAFFSILKVVTAFTLAHSITLSLAALDVVRLPSRLTESVIAASIVVAALNNIFPLVTESRARIAFAFGLLHGFGFASVLADMGLPHAARLICLLAFNLGIETGQLAVVLAVMPVVYALRSGAIYRRAVMPLGSAVIAVVALIWLVQRAFLPTG